MIELIFFILLCGIVYGFYIMTSNYYIRKQYILMEKVDSTYKPTKIRGNYLNITCNEKHTHIQKRDDKWYITDSTEENLTQLAINEEFKIGGRSFKIIETEKKGDLFLLLPLIATTITVLTFFSTVKLSIEESTNEDINPTQIHNTRNSSIENKNEPENEDIHTIVLKNNNLFQNNIMIDWTSYNKYNLNNGHIRYELANNISETGLNATYNQETINWKKVKADNVDFALIHIGSRRYGMDKNNGVEDIIIDPNFNKNISEAIANNIKVGTTFYSQATTKEEMDQEITAMLNAVKGYKLDYPMGISLDREERHRASILSNEDYIDLIKYFCIRITKKGYTPMILGKEEWFHQFPNETFDGYLKLVTTENNPPTDIDNCIIWGYEENSFDEIDGVNRTVSLYLSAYVNMHENGKK